MRQAMRRLCFVAVALVLAFTMRAPAALAFSPELSVGYWWSRIAREDRAGDQITRTSRSLPHLLTRLDLDLTSRFGVEGELMAPPQDLSDAAGELTEGSQGWPDVGYRVNATYRLPLIGAGVGPTYVHSVFSPAADQTVEVTGLGGVAEGSLALSNRAQLSGSVRYLPEAEVQDGGTEQKASYTGFQVGASLNVWNGLEAEAAYRQETAVVPNPMSGVQERAYEQDGYSLGLGYRF